MASKFDLRKFVSEFVRYANVIFPYDSQLGVFDFEIEFSVVRGRLCYALQTYDLYCGSSDYANDVYTLLESTIAVMNRNQGFCDLGKNRTFVLSVGKDGRGLVYGTVGV